jgi:hypothetical protein
MSRILSRRLQRLERTGGIDDPTAYFSARPLAPGEGAFIMADWRGAIARGEAKRRVPGLYIQDLEQPLTTEEWVRKYAPPEALA